MVSGPIALLLLVVAVAAIVILSSKLKINAYLVLVAVAFLYALAIGVEPQKVPSMVREGFGGLITKVGLIYLGGTIMGTMLEKTGGAVSLTRAILKLVGKKNSPLAVAFSGYVVSIPVNCDPGFIILTAVNKGLSIDTGYSMATMSVALAVGLLSTHAMVPPTAGPIAAAGTLGADLAQVILFGLVSSLAATLVGWLWATKVCSKYQLAPKDAISYEDVLKKFGRIPSVGHALLPILYPLIMICLASFSNLPGKPFGEGEIVQVIRVLGDPSTALFCSVILSFTLVPLKNLREAWSTWVRQALESAATIIFITAAGGAFGAVLAASPMVGFIGDTMSKWSLGLFLPFIIASVLKCAQGSSTVSIVTTSSIMAPLLPILGLNPVFTTLVIGAGSMIVSHTNDSYFWVISQFSDFEVDKALKYYTSATALAGVAAFITLFLLNIVVR